MTTKILRRYCLATCTLILAGPTLAGVTDLYVDDDAPPGGDGLSWATAFNSLDDAIDAQLGEDSVIRVAQGTYIPQGNINYPSTFPLSNAYGGYAGWDAPDPDLRDPDAFPTILSGDVNADDTPDFQNLADNLAQVVILGGIVDGFVITGAAGATELFEGNLAGGDNTVIRNCRFHHNSAAMGGALVLDNFEGLIKSCVFEHNRAIWDGVNGSGRGVGGAVYLYRGPATFHACRFSNNSALIGGAVGTFFDPIQSSAFVSCIFTANEATDPIGWCVGGAIGIFTQSSDFLFVEHCLLYGNHAPTGLGGGIFMGNGSVALANSVLWANSDTYGSAMASQMNVLPEATPLTGGVITNIIQGAPPIAPFDNPVAIGLPPKFIDPLGPDGILGTDDDDFRPAYGSPAIDAGAEDVAIPFPDDFAGNFRVEDDLATPNAMYADFTGISDLGPYEYGEDCDASDVLDSYEILNGILEDCDDDGVPDVCQPNNDCNTNAINDRCEIASGAAQDCNANGIPDSCDIASGLSADENGNAIPDECEPAILYVDATPGARRGSPWAGSYADLDSALAAADARHAPTEIWVAEGTYRPQSPTLGFRLPPHVTILGGFAGGETSADQRDPAAHPMILSGDMLDNDNPADPASFDDNAYNLINAGSADGALLDGLTVTGGFARPQPGPGVLVFTSSNEDPTQPDITVTRAPGDSGGALRLADGALTMRNCRLLANRAAVDSVVALVAAGRLHMHDCTVEDNHTTMSGASIFGHDDFGEPFALYSTLPGYPEHLAALEMIDTVALSNTHLDPDTNARLIDLYVTPLTLLRTLVTANEFDVLVRGFLSSPGAVLVSTVHILNSAFVANDAEAIDVTRLGANPGVRQLVLRNATIADNAAAIAAGNTFADIQNSILYDNGSDPLPPILTHANSLLRYNTIEGWNPADNNGANIVGNFDDDPMFLDPLGPDATPRTGDEDFRLMAGSSSIDSGDSAAAPVGPALDLARELRFVDDPAAPNTGPPHAFLPPVDRGAYERQIPANLHPADINGDNSVDVLDFGILAASFGTTDGPGNPADLNHDGAVNVRDFAILAAAWPRE